MPNWCENKTTFTHNDSKEIERLKNAIENDKFFSEFFPMPTEYKGVQSPNNDKVLAKHLTKKYGYPSWYEWCIANWGVKWEISKEDIEIFKQRNQNTLKIQFNSAWSPPIEFYEKMDKLGFIISAKYAEPAMGIEGTYKTETGVSQN